MCHFPTLTICKPTIQKLRTVAIVRHILIHIWCVIIELYLNLSCDHYPSIDEQMQLVLTVKLLHLLSCAVISNFAKTLQGMCQEDFSTSINLPFACNQWQAQDLLSTWMMWRLNIGWGGQLCGLQALRKRRWVKHCRVLEEAPPKRCKRNLR